MMEPKECSLEGTSEVTLQEMSPGECGYIQKVTGSGAIRRRMLEMGLIEGSLVQVIPRHLDHAAAARGGRLDFDECHVTRPPRTDSVARLPAT